jgi:hypothetical protein
MDTVCFSAYPRFVRPFIETGCPTWTNGSFRPFDSYIDGKETVFAGVVAAGLAVVLFIQDSPWVYYAYAGFPVFFWAQVLSNRETIWLGLQVLTQSDGKQVSPVTVTTQSILYIGILESLVITTSTVPPLLIVGVWILSPPYFQYWLYFCCIVAAYLWPEILQVEFCFSRILGALLRYHE